MVSSRTAIERSAFSSPCYIAQRCLLTYVLLCNCAKADLGVEIGLMTSKVKLILRIQKRVHLIAIPLLDWLC